MAYFEFENEPSEQTPISAENLMAMQIGLMELVFPVGSIYITQDGTNPSDILNFGTWERVKGEVLVGLDEDDKDFNMIGKEGGEKTHTLTVDEIPPHSHLLHLVSKGVYGNGSQWATVYDDGGDINSFNTGNGNPHNIVQPYIVVGYMWRRTE